MRAKKLLTALIVCAMLVGLSACESTDSNNDTSSQVVSESVSSQETESVVESATDNQSSADSEAESETDSEEEEFKPIESISYTEELNGKTVSFDMVKLDTPIQTPSVSYCDFDMRDNKLYFVNNGSSVMVYDLTDNGATLSEEIEYEKADAISVGADGTIFVNGGVFAPVPIVDGKAGEKCAVAGDLLISPDGSYGLSYFTSRELPKVTINGKELTEEKTISTEAFKTVYGCRPFNDYYIVYGKLLEEDSSGIIVYNMDGTEKYRAVGVDSQNNYQDVVVLPDGGVMATTPACLGFADADGKPCGKIKIHDGTGNSLWPIGSYVQDDGTIIMAAISYQTNNEIVVLRIKGL